jgi:hypothetical protein
MELEKARLITNPQGIERERNNEDDTDGSRNAAVGQGGDEGGNKAAKET